MQNIINLNDFSLYKKMKAIVYTKYGPQLASAVMAAVWAALCQALCADQGGLWGSGDCWWLDEIAACEEYLC